MKAKTILYLVFGSHAVLGILSFIGAIFLNNLITIPKEDRVYTTALITHIERGMDDTYTVKGEIIIDNEIEKEVELDFYYSGMDVGQKIEMYYDKNDIENNGCDRMDSTFPIFYIIPAFFAIEGSIGTAVTLYLSNKNKTSN